jgi:hypothetical protein
LTNIRSLQKLNCQAPFTIYCLIILDLRHRKIQHGCSPNDRNNDRKHCSNHR